MFELLRWIFSKKSSGLAHMLKHELKKAESHKFDHLKMKVTLVKNRGVPVSVGVGRNCFSLENGVPVHDEAQKIGAEVAGKSKQYQDAFELACWAVENQMYDNTEEHW